jgi:hypothetical protein
MVGQIGQPVAGRALQRDPVAAQQHPSAGQVEDERSADRGQQADQAKGEADVVQLGVQHMVVVAELERVLIAAQRDGCDELEVVAVTRPVGLPSCIARARQQRRADPLIGMRAANGVRGAGRHDHRARVDQQRLQRAGTLRDCIE